MSSSPLFSVVVSDSSNGTEPIIYHGTAGGDSAWVLLNQSGPDVFLIYSWNGRNWRSISESEFKRYKAAYNFMLLEVGVVGSQWDTVPMTRSITRSQTILNSIPAKRKATPRVRDRIAAHGMASLKVSEDLSDFLGKFVEIEDSETELLPGLEDARASFVRDWK